jgi:hypothetical protein
MTTKLAQQSLSAALLTLIAASAVQAQATQPAASLALQGTWYRSHSQTAYVYVRNDSDKPLKLTELQIDGQVESAEPWPLDEKRKAHWFDFIPATVASGAVSQVRVNLRDAVPSEGVKLSINTDAGAPLVANVLPTEPAIYFADIAFAKDGSTATLFLAGADATITRVLMDGVDITDKSDLRGATSFKGTAAVVVRPAAPLARGSYHVFEAITADGRAARYASRTLADDFILGTYGNPESFQLYKDNALNTYVSFRNLTPPQLDQLKALGISAGPVPFVGGHFDPKTKAWLPYDAEKSKENLEALKAAGGVAFYANTDEPDGYDSAAKTLGMHGRVTVAARQLAEQIDPGTPSFIQIDNSLRPHNYHVYAEAMDYSCTHRYNLGQEFLAGDREATAQLRNSSQPQPYFWVTQLYPVREKEGERVAYNGRDPVPGEMQMQMLEAVSNGSKGIVHYIHSGSRGGRGGSGLNQPLWDAMKPFHQQLAVAGPVIARSTPTNWASSSVPEARTVALLGDANDVIVSVTNQSVVSGKTEFTVPQLKNVTVTISLPQWVEWKEIVEVLPGGTTRPLNAKNENGNAIVTLDAVDVGTILWIRGGQK